MLFPPLQVPHGGSAARAHVSWCPGHPAATGTPVPRLAGRARGRCSASHRGRAARPPRGRVRPALCSPPGAMGLGAHPAAAGLAFAPTPPCQPAASGAGRPRLPRQREEEAAAGQRRLWTEREGERNASGTGTGRDPRARPCPPAGTAAGRAGAAGERAALPARAPGRLPGRGLAPGRTQLVLLPPGIGDRALPSGQGFSPGAELRCPWRCARCAEGVRRRPQLAGGTGAVRCPQAARLSPRCASRGELLPARCPPRRDAVARFVAST